jgi:phage repressor protein C with HTH and peptisase S24 domain
MREISDIRRDNLRRLIEVMGGATALALKLKYANGTYLSQIAGPKPTRTLGEKAARHIEKTLILPPQWMDTPNAPLHFSSAALGAKNATLAIVKAADFKANRDHEDRHPPARVIEHQNGPRDLPVFGQVQGGFDGVEVDYETPVDYISRPASLIGAKNACGVYVTGDSMEPRYFAGEIVLVDPRRPARPGDFVVVELPEHRAIVKRLVRRNDHGTVLAQLNPAGEEVIARTRIVGIYRIIGTMTD